MHTKGNLKTKINIWDLIIKTSLQTILGGLSMWIVAGLWHNLILPIVNENMEAHHDGLVIMLISYFILALLMVYIFSLTRREVSIKEGAYVGAIIGILWVFPHGLAMAGVHDTSTIYEIKNGLYHMIEQGIGGIVIAGLSKMR